MKKILFYLLAAGALFSVGCSKDAGVDTPVVEEGKYTLSEFSAELDEAETRTGLGTGNVVNWSNKDRILLVNRTTGLSEQYILVSGAGTSVGTFRPFDSPLPYTPNVDEIVAVYPAVAATVTGSGTNTKISVSINQNYLNTQSQDWLDGFGITSYTKDSPYAFTYNDIKVSYKSNPIDYGVDARPNFKFKQLGVWCTFYFDMTSDSGYSRDKMISMAVEAPNAISGTAEIDFADTKAPKLKAGTDKKVEWEFNTVSSMATVFTRSFMLFPNVSSSDMLKITAKADGHDYTFYATPKQAFEAGTTLRLPIILKNFHYEENPENFAYSATDNTTNKFYYYGTANCYQVAPTGTGATINVTPYVANRFYEQTGNSGGTIPANKKPTTAKLIWREDGITLSVGTINTSTWKFSVSNVQGNGNALVGIYNSSNQLLWSYHIWKPSVAPTLLSYTVTNSGSYKVMSMALGAMKAATLTDLNDDKLASYGLYYQWGRKDPLGRPNAITASGNGYVKVYDSAGADQGSGYWVTAANVKELSENTGAILDGVDQTVDGFALDRYMIDYAVANPTVFIKVPNGTYNNDWAGVTNNNLWANPEGYNYPEQSQLPGRSVFDPCPAGYHVAPKDLWLNFSQTRNNTSKPEEFNVEDITTNPISSARGYNFYYQGWQSGPKDFYPASGYRYRETGALGNVGAYGECWSSSPAAAGSGNACYLEFYSVRSYPMYSSCRAHGFAVRCVQNQ